MRRIIVKDSRKVCPSNESASDLAVVCMGRGAEQNQTVQDDLIPEVRQGPRPMVCLAL